MTAAPCQESLPRWRSNTAIFTAPDATLEILMPTNNEPDPWRDTFASMATFLVMIIILVVTALIFWKLVLYPVWSWAT